MACRIPLVRIGKNDVAVFKPLDGVSPAPWIHRIMADSGEQIAPPKRKGRVDISPEAEARHNDDLARAMVVPESFFYQSGDSSTSYHGLVP